MASCIAMIDKQKIWRDSSKCNWKSLWNNYWGRVNNKSLWVKCSLTWTLFLVKSDFFSAFHRVLHWPARIHITRSEIAPLICIKLVPCEFPSFLYADSHAQLAQWAIEKAGKGSQQPETYLTIRGKRTHDASPSATESAFQIPIMPLWFQWAFVQPTPCLTVKTKQ